MSNPNTPPPVCAGVWRKATDYPKDKEPCEVIFRRENGSIFTEWVWQPSSIIHSDFLFEWLDTSVDPVGELVGVLKEAEKGIVEHLKTMYDNPYDDPFLLQIQEVIKKYTP